MAPLGDGFRKSIEHKHFIKVLIGFMVLVLLVWSSYHFLIRDKAALEDQARQYQARQ